MALEKFTYKYDGKKITLPKTDSIPFGAMRKMRKANEDEQFFVLIENVADEDTLAFIDSMPTDEVVNLMKAWFKDSGADLGE